MRLPVDYNILAPYERKAVREEYIKRQKGLCQHCGGDLKVPPPKKITDKPIKKRLYPDGFFKWPVHLHHDHVTGMTIGAVHNYCNAVLWEYHGQ